MDALAGILPTAITGADIGFAVFFIVACVLCLYLSGGDLQQANFMHQEDEDKKNKG
ncbi:MAG: hypothetical protein RSE47_00935 [Acidaminococcaceae bacterium]